MAFQCFRHLIRIKDKKQTMNHILTTLLVMLPLLLAGSPAAARQKPDAETEKLMQRTEPYLLRVEKEPDWLVSRLQMYWTTHATDVFINGEAFDHPGGKRAPEPTVKFAGTRGTASQYNRPRLEDIVPYDDDEQGDVTFINRSTGQMEKAHPSKTGCNIQGVNRQVMGIARDAARIYHATGDRRWGKMAADVFTTYMKGIWYRHAPIDLNHGHQQTLVGMATFEVIHEDILSEITEAYPLVRDLVANDRRMIDAALKKWADLIIANGVPHNNWDLFQADFIMRIALVLDDDKAYADGKGRQYYLDYIAHRDSIRQWSMDKLIDFGFDKRSKTWYESAGYSLTVLSTFADFANRLDRDGGLDLVGGHPILAEAFMAAPQYLFPNRLFVGFGDSHPNPIGTGGIDHLLAYARRHGRQALEDSLLAVRAAVQPQASVAAVESLTSQMFHAPNVSWLAMRTGMDDEHDLMASLNGSLGNHQHANGISLELYGKGYVLGPDAGIGRHLYSGLDYQEYYSQMPAHNTVVVDGISSYPVMMSNHAFHIVAAQPGVTAEQPSSGMLTARKDSFCYATVTFTEPETQARQQRTVAVVKTSRTGGFYIDVFRSRKMEGGDKTHDYFYHNLGQTMTLTALDGSPLPLQPTDELAFAGGHLYAYSYIYNKVCAPATAGVKATFTTRLTDDKAVAAKHGQHEITMTMWMAPAEGRTAFQALSPANLEYERMPNQPYKIGEQPVLTFVARQQGEAWQRPFVAVYEPASDTEPGDIDHVGFFQPEKQGAAGVAVTLKDGRTLRYVCKENGEVVWNEK